MLGVIYLSLPPTDTAAQVKVGSNSTHSTVDSSTVKYMPLLYRKPMPKEEARRCGKCNYYIPSLHTFILTYVKYIAPKSMPILGFL